VPDSTVRSSFWWRDILKQLVHYKGMTAAHVHDGRSCLFWLDLWNNRLLHQDFPELFSFVRDANISVHNADNMVPLHSLFHLPLSIEAYDQYQQLEHIVLNINFQQRPDHWSYMWGFSIFSSSKAYRRLIGHRTVHHAFHWLWKSKCQNKRKFFFWLVLQDRLSTRNLLYRRNMALQDYSCVHCVSTIEETLLHLFVECPFAQACWNTLHLLLPTQNDFFQVLVSLKAQIRLPFFMEIVITMCWSIWTVQNDLIFRNMLASVQRCRSIFKQEFALVMLRAQGKYQP
jgi:hypothetical protein